jgi:hypothetical protein
MQITYAEEETGESLSRCGSMMVNFDGSIVPTGARAAVQTGMSTTKSGGTWTLDRSP